MEQPLPPAIAEAIKLQEKGDPTRPGCWEYNEAYSLLSMAIAKGQEPAIAYNARWHIRFLRGDYDGALDDLNRAVILDPKMAYAYYHRGLVHQKIGDSSRAARDFRTAAELAEEESNDELTEAVARHFTGSGHDEVRLIESVRLRFESIFHYVSDLDASIRFYRDVLELDMQSRSTVARFDVDGIRFELVPVPEGATVAPGGGAHLCLSVADIDAAREWLKSKGVPLTDTRIVDGGFVAAFEDPDGNEIFLWQHSHHGDGGASNATHRAMEHYHQRRS